VLLEDETGDVAPADAASVVPDDVRVWAPGPLRDALHGTSLVEYVPRHIVPGFAPFLGRLVAAEARAFDVDRRRQAVRHGHQAHAAGDLGKDMTIWDCEESGLEICPGELLLGLALGLAMEHPVVWGDVDPGGVWWACYV